MAHLYGRVEVVMLSLTLGMMACGGVSTSGPQRIRPDYCTEYPGNRFYCSGERFSLDDAMREVQLDGALPADAVLASIHSSPAGGLAPDGLQSTDGEWVFFFVSPNGTTREYTARIDGVLLGQSSSDFACTPDAAVSIRGLVEDIERATVLMEDGHDVVYEPGTFSLNAFRDAACFSNVGRRHTLVHSQSDIPTRRRFTVEFDERYPDGILCELNDDGCEE